MSTESVSVDIREIEAFLYDEAALLDRPNLDEWIQLYTDDGTYWMPVAVDQEDPINHNSLFYDDRVMMEIRRRNFVHPRAASKDYVVRCSHIISNTRLRESTDDGRTLRVTANFQCVVYYNEDQTLYAGTYEYELVRESGRLLIRRKRVNLINSDGVLGTMVIYI